MKFCDITIAYNQSSGGIRTYLDEKRRYLLERTDHEHLLIVPGEFDAIERQGRSTTIYIDSPLLPNQDSYRFFLRPNKIRNILLQHRPDVIELGSYYLSPWAAFAYRERLQADGQNCVIGCYFHTDVAEAYVAAPLRSLTRGRLGGWSESLAGLGEKLAALAETGAEKYIGTVFSRCDLALASSATQAARLQEYGVEQVQVVPLGVDLERFHPRFRSDAVRARHGAGPENLVLIYGGRLSSEKHVPVLLDALQRLPADLKPLLWISGDGPLRDEIKAMAGRHESLRLLPYQGDRTAFARLLASADLYVTAGPHETFALSVIEAQAAGLPVVGVDAGALRERVPETLGYLGPVGDARAMADNIIRAAAERKLMGERARRHVARHFSWKNSFGELLELYGAELDRLRGALPSGLR